MSVVNSNSTIPGTLCQVVKSVGGGAVNFAKKHPVITGALALAGIAMTSGASTPLLASGAACQTVLVAANTSLVAATASTAVATTVPLSATCTLCQVGLVTAGAVGVALNASQNAKVQIPQPQMSQPQTCLAECPDEEMPRLSPGYNFENVTCPLKEKPVTDKVEPGFLSRTAKAASQFVADQSGWTWVKSTSLYKGLTTNERSGWNWSARLLAGYATIAGAIKLYQHNNP